MSRILLAIDQPETGRAQLRATLLARQLGVQAFDVVATRRTGAGGGARTAYSQLRVDGGVLFAMVDGKRHRIDGVVGLGNMPHAWTVSNGNAAAIVAAAAEDIGADLVVLPGRAGSTIARWLRPAKGTDVVRMCRGPVLLVNAEPRETYGKILVALDFSRASLAAARAALRMAPEASFTFLHAWRLPDEGLMRELELPERVIARYREQGRESASTRLDAYVDQFFPGIAAPSRVVHHGSPHRAIVHHARQWGADLIVIGKERACHARRFMAASLAQRLARHGACDLLTGPAPQGRGDDQRLAA